MTKEDILAMTDFLEVWHAIQKYPNLLDTEVGEHFNKLNYARIPDRCKDPDAHFEVW